MTNEEELSKHMMIIEQYKQQLSQLEMQYQYIQAAIADYQKAKITLEEINKKGKNEEILVPIGGSTYINAKASDTSKVLYDIGSGIVTEKKPQDAIKKIDERIDDLSKTLERVVDTIQQLQAEATEVSAKAQKLMQENQG